jgi:hypothetical protein
MRCPPDAQTTVAMHPRILFSTHTHPKTLKNKHESMEEPPHPKDPPTFQLFSAPP